MFSKLSKVQDPSTLLIISSVLVIICKQGHVSMIFFVPRVQGIASKTFFFYGINDWNRLPDSIKSIKNHVTFKHRVKEFLVKSAIGLENCDFLSYPAR